MWYAPVWPEEDIRSDNGSWIVSGKLGPSSVQKGVAGRGVI